MYTTLITTNALQTENDGTWAIIDCRFDLQREDWGRDQYATAHVPSAVYAHLGHDLSGTMTGTNGRHPLPSISEMTTTFSSMGITPVTQVVVYDQDTGMFASRLWWMLRYVGHAAVAVLDGGWTKWTGEGRPTRGGIETRPATAFVARLNPEMIAGIPTVLQASGERGTLLVDARAPERFEGRTEPLDRVAGHIPGAVNRFFKRNVDAEGTFRAPDALRADFAELLGDKSPQDAIMYCGSGVTACHNLLALEHAGLPGARLYPGSWSEWCADPARPTATGPS